MSTNGWKRTNFSSNKNAFGTAKIDWDKLYVPLKVADGSKIKRTVRFLQEPVPYRVHWPKKRDAQTKQNYNHPFPDAGATKKVTRVCHKNYVKDEETGNWVFMNNKPCPWCDQGFNVQTKKICNVIYRAEDGNTIRLLDITASALEPVYEWVELAEEKGAENCDPASWKEAAPNFIFTISKEGAQTKYSAIHDDSPPLSEEDRKLIRDLSEELTPKEDLVDGKPVRPRLYPLDYFTTPNESGAKAPLVPAAATPRTSVSNVHAEEEVASPVAQPLAVEEDVVEEEEEESSDGAEDQSWMNW
jgi:hypothetical protein